MLFARLKKWGDSIRYGFFVAACLLVVVLPALAQTGGTAAGQEGQGQEQEQKKEKHFLYQWTDSKGNVHITDDPGTVPKRYRSTVRQVEALPEEETGSVEQRSSPGPGISDTEEREADLKEIWQQRMKEARRRLTDLEKQYRVLDQQRNEALGRWGGAASGHLEDKEEAARIDQEIKQIQQEISDARNQVEVVIPDEARKAGIPPGWLRE